MKSQITNLQKVLNSEIPLTNAIGIKVEEYDHTGLTLSAPLDKNTNHESTAFGGSLYSLSVLSGWGLVYLLLKENNLAGHIVIHESNTKFIKPVTTDIIAKCTLPSQNHFDRFLQIYQRKGIARLKLESQIQCNNEICVVFNGNYVVHK